MITPKESLFMRQSPGLKAEPTLDGDLVVPIFAPHPRFFSGSISHGLHPSHFSSQPYALTNIGVRLQVGVAVKLMPGDNVARFMRLDSVPLFKVERSRKSGQLAEKMEACEVYLCKKISWASLASEGEMKQLDVPHSRDFLFLTQAEAEIWGKRWADAAEVQYDDMSDLDPEYDI
ncbi:hypothetical protein K458DRAFT_406308 [Lentithecium fluviatile CBS 122367]|uniref:Uncharacterized protein n=1 Tax=Lentithecium fluviatile CBS 122367 TaxID=1168545 RepID=A0A6G1ITZ5_9PLEO|nr:hypothetical protein K458DRAFT_406308 [Lentithecium fluviatile CBS 122367]